MKQGRPIGRRIRQLCETLEQVEPASPLDLGAWLSYGKSDTAKYCRRAAAYGLVALAGNQYRTLANWRERIANWHKDDGEEASPARTFAHHRGNPWAGLMSASDTQRSAARSTRCADDFAERRN